MRGDSARNPVTDAETFPRQRAIGSKLARHTRQKPRRPDIRKEANADLRHSEGKPVTGDPMRSMHGNADAATHRDAVDQCDVRFAIVLDRRVERIFVAPELQRFIVATCFAEIIERTNVAAGGKGAPVCRGDDHARDRASSAQRVSCARNASTISCVTALSALRPVERDNAGRTPPLEQNVVFAHADLERP